MKRKLQRFLSALSVLALLLSGCSSAGGSPGTDAPDGRALTWVTWGGYDKFWQLLGQTYPDIEIEFIPYDGANYTGYSWAQMRGDDISELFCTSQILDEELMKERLVDLSGYDFISNLSTSVLDQVSVDGGVYLLPVSNTMYGIFYNKTLMEENGWEVPRDFAELSDLCAKIEAEGLIPGMIGTQLAGNAFSAVFNLAKTDWLTTPMGLNWERDFLAGNAAAAGTWEKTMDYVQQYMDIGMFRTAPGNPSNSELIEDYMAQRKIVFLTMAAPMASTHLSNGDEVGMMPYISRDGSKNVYMYNPTSYIGISRRLTEPGNEEKLEQAIRLLALLYSPEGQAAFTSDSTPCIMDVLSNSTLPEDSLIYDAQQAHRENRAFRMTYAHWENVLAEMGTVFSEWLRGENGLDGAGCIARMDEIQGNYLNRQESVYYSESTADFTLEETARLVGKALGVSAGTDAAMVPYSPVYTGEPRLRAGITGKLYEGRINTEISNSIAPGYDGEYAVLTMTGAQAKELAGAGFDRDGDGNVFPYVLVARGGELEDNLVYRVAFPMGAYTEETGEACGARVEKGSLRAFLRSWLEQEGKVSPGGNPWN